MRIFVLNENVCDLLRESTLKIMKTVRLNRVRIEIRMHPSSFLYFKETIVKRVWFRKAGFYMIFF